MGYDLKVLQSIHHLARYAAFAYGDDDGARFRMLTPELEGPAKARKLEAKGPSWFSPNIPIHLGIRDKQQTLVIVFGGADSPWLYEDIVVRPESVPRLIGSVLTDLCSSLGQIDWGDCPEDVWVHQQYLLTFNELRKDLLTSISNLKSFAEELRGSPLAPTFQKIEVCGYGLGGALATLCSLWCATQWRESQIICVTLSSPKVGDEGFANEFGKRKIECYRLTMECDPSTTMPYAYQYHGARVWKHVGTKVCLPRYEGQFKSFGILGQFLDIAGHPAEFALSEDFNKKVEPIAVYLGIHFRLWIIYCLLKGAQLILSVSVRSPMVYPFNCGGAPARSRQSGATN